MFFGASCRIGCNKHNEVNQTRKGPYAPKQVLSEGNGIHLLLLLSFSFLVCEQLLKGVVYPLAVKAHSVLDNYSIKKNTLLSGAARSSSSPFVGAFSLSLLIYIYMYIFTPLPSSTKTKRERRRRPTKMQRSRTVVTTTSRQKR